MLAVCVCVGVAVCECVRMCEERRIKLKTPISRKRLEKSTLKNHSLCVLKWFSGTTPQAGGESEIVFAFSFVRHSGGRKRTKEATEAQVIERSQSQ